MLVLVHTPYYDFANLMQDLSQNEYGTHFLKIAFNLFCLLFFTRFVSRFLCHYDVFLAHLYFVLCTVSIILNTVISLFGQVLAYFAYFYSLCFVFCVIMTYC